VLCYVAQVGNQCLQISLRQGVGSRTLASAEAAKFALILGRSPGRATLGRLDSLSRSSAGPDPDLFGCTASVQAVAG
jgi:hypothetical protein